MKGDKRHQWADEHEDDDELNGFRGIVYGLMIAAVMWSLIIWSLWGRL
jgi:hypothetical protein